MSGYKGKHEADQPKDRREKKPSRLTRQQKVLVAICVLLLIALGLVLGYRSLFARPDIPDKPGTGLSKPGDSAAGSQAEEIDYGDGVRPHVGGERKSESWYTVLILGRDTGGGGNTDTMLLASYDVTNQKAAVMSIPRDTMVNVPWDLKRINSVYNYYGGGEKGIQHVYKEVSQLVGFEPDYQVVVEWEAVGKIVEAMGGVNFDVPRNMSYDDPAQNLHIHQAKGYRLLSGDDAMQVLRWRKNNDGTGYPDGDIGRIRTQQDLLKAMVKQLLQLSTVTKLGELSKVFQESVETDLAFKEILWFAQQAVLGGLGVDDVEFLTLPGNYTASAYSRSVSKMLGRDSYQSYVTPYPNQLLKLVNEKLSPFAQTFTLKDLDIMSVNQDGSLSSSTGYVEDTVAASPPVKLGDGKDQDPETQDPEDGQTPSGLPEGVTIGPNGEIIGPDGSILYPGDTQSPGTGTTPPGGAATQPGASTQPGNGDPGGTDPGVTTPPASGPDPSTAVDPGMTTDPGTAADPGTAVDPSAADPNGGGEIDWTETPAEPVEPLI